MRSLAESPSLTGEAQPPKAGIFFGDVMHVRLRPRRNAFRYRVFFLRFPISAIERMENALFSVNRWNIFSFHYRDYGPRDGSHPEAWLRNLLSREGLENGLVLIWNMNFRMRSVRPHEVQVIRGVSHLRFGESGKVNYHRDYWDTGEELYSKLPLIGGVARLLRRMGG